MAEHGLDGSSPVIGLSFDFTGYGEDGAVRGGEFLIADYQTYQRPFHLKYFPLPGGDVAIKRPARTALALLWLLGLEWDERLAPVRELRETDQKVLKAQLEKKINSPLTSSMSRLFDAAAALAGIPILKISAKFHNGLAEIVCAAVNRISKDTGIHSVALSGEFGRISPY